MSEQGQAAFEAYAGKAGGRSLISGERLAGWDALPRDIKDAWDAAAAAVSGGSLEGHRELNGVTATQCQLGAQDGVHQALRFVWHHILPQVCGGKSVKSNLAELCDNCHYAVHALLWGLAHGAPPPKQATDGQYRLAQIGYQLAVQAGTQGKIPKESGS